MTFARILLAACVFAGGIALGKWNPWLSQFDRHADSSADIGNSAIKRNSPAANNGENLAQTASAANTPARVGGGASAPSSIEAIAAEPSALRRRVLAKRYFDQILLDQFPSLLASVAAIEDTDVLQMFFLSWTGKDPAAALDAINALTSEVRGGILARCLGVWARVDLNAATKWSERLTGREKRGIDLMLEQIAKGSGTSTKPVDPTSGLHPRDRFWSFVSLSANGVGMSNKTTKVLPALREWVSQNPVEASEAILKSSMLRRDEELLRAIYDEWKGKDPAGADRFLSSLPAESADVLILSLALEASTKDVAGARLLAERLPTPHQRSAVLTKVGAKIAAEDPSQAPVWIETLQQANPNFLPMSIFKEWFKRDPAAAVRMLSEHPAYQKFRTEKPGERVVANYFDFRPWVEQDPAAAAKFLADLPNADRATSLYNLGNGWVEKDPTGAIQWARSLSNPEAQDEALRQFTFSWAKSNALGVTKHLDALPAGSGKSAAIEGFAFATFDVDPDAVLQWVRAIPEESKRLDVLSRAWSDWNRKNPRAAVDWMENVGELDAAERKAIEER